MTFHANELLTILLADMHMESHGGVADTIANLASRLGDYGIRPIVILQNPVKDGHPYVRFMRERGVEVWAVKETQARLVMGIIRLIVFMLWPLVLLDAALRHKTCCASQRSLWGVLRRIGYTGLRCIFYMRLMVARVCYRARLLHFFKPDMWPAIKFMKFLGLKTLYTEGTNPQGETPYYYVRLAGKSEYIDGVTAVSRASALGIDAYLPRTDAIKIIPNMVEMSVIPEIITKVRINKIGVIARLAPQKDIGTFLRACTIVHPKLPDVDLVIYGDGPEIASLLTLREALGLEEAVEFAGAFDKRNLSQILSALDILVLSSISEGLPITILEAMAMQKPVVATAVGGVSDVVEDGITGILVPPRAPEQLAEAICRLAADSELRARMGQAGFHKWQKHFTPEAIVPQYVELYHALLD